MFFFYQFIIIKIVVISPLIILFRLFKNKEHKTRFIEKFSLIKRKRPKGNLIWFHAASVGELMSIIPLIQEIEKNKTIKTVLITTSTLSSSKIFENFKFKKTVHQFFLFFLKYFTFRFLEYWQSTIAIFIDSVIWPSMF